MKLNIELALRRARDVDILGYTWMIGGWQRKLTLLASNLILSKPPAMQTSWVARAKPSYLFRLNFGAPVS